MTSLLKHITKMIILNILQSPVPSSESSTQSRSRKRHLEEPCAGPSKKRKKPQAPVPKGKGTSRGKGKGKGKAPAASARRRKNDDEEFEEEQVLLKKQQETMRAEVGRLTKRQMADILCQAINFDPRLMMQPAARQPGGYHPQPGDAVPNWCICGRCREMPTQSERRCCGKAKCLSLYPDFDLLILHERVLALARIFRRDLLVFEDDVDLMRANRHQAYRQFTLWSYGRLGAGDRRVIPSCCVWRIRDKFPDPFGQYKGYIRSRLG
ncbi:P2RX7-like protein [Mya arenaria]|uniref:P2RX7-like protein n=1 Tax=Mya arenaria TaxID=6604 RepID=A0ABY7ETI9_MYAAR|nr:P2RX7-like protein [Mya arenaria]